MYHANQSPQRGEPLDPSDAAMLGPEGTDLAARIVALADPAPTPLHDLPALAAHLGIGRLQVKDEGRRLGLSSFKALGGAYAVKVLVLRAAAAVLGRALQPEDLSRPDVRAVAAAMTFACATDGNHGRSVAQGAAAVGARSVIFVHRGVSDARIAAIAAFGAEMRRVDGNYDDSVEEAARVAAAEGWTIVSDTSWPGYEEIPGLVMQGYTLMVREAMTVMEAPPTHLFLQAGVGGFAAAVAGHFALIAPGERPNVTVVEPDLAACLLESARAGEVVRAAETQPTVMAMLECYEPSRIAFRVLERLADGFMAIPDDRAVAAMRRLAEPLGDDPAIVAGESGGVGLAGLMAALADPATRAATGLWPSSRVLVIVTEGATDPQLYRSIVGRAPADVLAGRAA